jgi:hypothetical protein
MKLPKEIISHINRKSHAAGIHHAAKEKIRLTAELELLLADGATLDQLNQYIEVSK